MPRHEFGIIESNDNKNEFFFREDIIDECITVDDDYILPLLLELKIMKTYHHKYDNPSLGLDYYGCTIIPLESLGFFQEILLKKLDCKEAFEVNELISMITEAIQHKKDIIHFGI